MKAPFFRVLLLLAIMLAIIAALSLLGNTARPSVDDDDDEMRITGVIESLPNTPGFIG